MPVPGRTQEGVWVQIAAAFPILFFVKKAAEAAPQGETSPTIKILLNPAYRHHRNIIRLLGVADIVRQSRLDAHQKRLCVVGP
jgi:hypothetical protein